MSSALKRFEELTMLDGTSGFENEISKYLEENLSKYADEIKYDNLGGIYAIKKSKKENAKTVMIAAHMDEVGFIVTKILPNGMLKFETLGGFRENVLLAQTYTVTSYEGKKFTGVIGSVPKHFTAGIAQNVKINDMTIDLGAASREEVLAMGIREGAFVTPKTNFEQLTEYRFMSKAIDNRYGCVIITEILEQFADKELDINLVVCATVQEEVGLRGASAAVHMVKPDVCFVVDCSPANDMDGSATSNGCLGEGFLVRLVDRTMVLRPNMREKIVELAEKNSIKYQYFTSPGGTDGGNIHQALTGVPTTVIGICARYIHTHNSIFDIRDYYAAKSILEKLIETIDDKFIEDIRK
ncbi:M42 family metallopeptidase [Gemella bergeri]